MASILTLILILTLSILITRIATIAIAHTGLSHESAKFQARSAFTGVGFTTTEAEKVATHPVRRRIIMLLMLLGNAGIVSAIATLLMAFIDTDKDSIPWYVDLLVLAGAIFLLWAIFNNKLFDRWLRRIVSRSLKRYTEINVRDYAKLLHLSGDYQITELEVRKKDWLCDNELQKLDLYSEGINVIAIHKHDGSFVGVPKGKTKLEVGDIIILYGREEAIKNLDARSKGVHGNIEHREMAEKQDKVESSEEDLEKEKD